MPPNYHRFIWPHGQRCRACTFFSSPQYNQNDENRLFAPCSLAAVIRRVILSIQVASRNLIIVPRCQTPIPVLHFLSCVSFQTMNLFQSRQDDGRTPSAVTTPLVTVSVIFSLLSAASIVLRFYARRRQPRRTGADDVWLLIAWVRHVPADLLDTCDRGI